MSLADEVVEDFEVPSGDDELARSANIKCFYTECGTYKDFERPASRSKVDS
jgi:hypothetical protein